MKSKLPDPKNLVHPKQPLFVYDIKKRWEEVVQSGPTWLSKKYPPHSSEKKYSFLGHKLFSPIAISAGPASGKKWTDFYLKMGFGLVFEKTRRTVQRKSHPVPNIAIVHTQGPITREGRNKTLVATTSDKDWEKYQSITNSFGNPSPSIEVWAKELARQKEAVGDGQLLGCSVTATFLGKNSNNSTAAIIEVASDLLVGATAAVVAGAQVIELNLACPNVTENKVEGEMFQNEKLVAYTLAEFKRRFPNIPVGIKFGIYKSKEQMKRVFVGAGENLDFVSGINAVTMTVLAKDGGEILPGRKTSGVAGKADQTLALEAIGWAAKIREEEGLKYEILGGGGIVEIKDVDRYLKAGADIVQIATIAMLDPLFAYKYRLYKENV